MENSLDAVKCPVCGNSPLVVAEYPSKLGYRLTCKCEAGLRVRIYLDNFAKGASLPFLVKPAAVSPRPSRAKELLARAAALVGEEKQAA